MPPDTVVAALDALTAADPARPLLTYYDDATGERTELSRASFANWVAKTANLVLDGAGAGPTDLGVVCLRAHWLTGAVLLGCWSAGLTVALSPESGGAVGFAEVGQVAALNTDERYALSLAPMGAPLRGPAPAGASDYVLELRPYGDRYAGPRPSPNAVALADGTTHAQLLRRALDVGVRPGARLLYADPEPDPFTWLLAPMVAGASIVLCANLDQSRLAVRLGVERATLG